MARNPYAPPAARALELPSSAQAWGRVGMLAPSFATAFVVTVGLFFVGAINSGHRVVISLGFFLGLFVAYWFALALTYVVGLLFRHLAQHWDLGQIWVAIAMGTAVGGLSVLA